MAIPRYTLPSLWTLVALVMVCVNPVTSQPIRSRQWAEPREVKDLNARGFWTTFEKEESTPDGRLSRAEHTLVGYTDSIELLD